MARLMSRELIESSIEICNNDPDHLKRAQLLTGKVIIFALDTPDDKDVYVTYTFDKGKCTAYEMDEEDAPSALRDRPFAPLKDGLARVTASYEMFVKLDRGEIDAADAMNSSDYKIEGNMVMLLPLMQAVDSWTKKIREIPKEY
ncbi:MAG: SCP2 sterol-binding domain-containing protein [Deltaproteobacteria bacterium]|nr:SCP2 sterol-binding domain-containing protein [Deltaproteobacteria bacterium]